MIHANWKDEPDGVDDSMKSNDGANVDNQEGSSETDPNSKLAELLDETSKVFTSLYENDFKAGACATDLRSTVEKAQGALDQLVDAVIDGHAELNAFESRTQAMLYEYLPSRERVAAVSSFFIRVSDASEVLAPVPVASEDESCRRPAGSGRCSGAERYGGLCSRAAQLVVRAGIYRHALLGPNASAANGDGSVQ